MSAKESSVKRRRREGLSTAAPDTMSSHIREPHVFRCTFLSTALNSFVVLTLSRDPGAAHSGKATSVVVVSLKCVGNASRVTISRGTSPVRLEQENDPAISFGVCSKPQRLSFWNDSS